MCVLVCACLCVCVCVCLYVCVCVCSRVSLFSARLRRVKRFDLVPFLMAFGSLACRFGALGLGLTSWNILADVAWSEPAESLTTLSPS